jgi:hypothetical protein
MSPAWIILVPLAAVGAGCLALWRAGVRRDRAWATEVARRVRQREADELHDRRYLAWLEEQFATEEERS